MGSQVKFGRSQSGKVISESPESPNVHSSTGEIWRMYLQGEIPRTSRTQRQKYIHQKDIQKDGPKVLDGVGLEVATHRATPPGNPGLQSFRNMFSMPKCRHRNSEFRKSTKSSNLQVQLQSGFRFFSLNFKKTNPNPMEFSCSTRLAIQLNSSTSRLAVSRLRMNISLPKRREKTGENSSWRPGHEFAFNQGRFWVRKLADSVGSVFQLEGVEHHKLWPT